MMKRFQKIGILTLALFVLVLAFFNFIPQIQASSIQGTTTNLNNPELLYYYMCHFGPQYMNNHWIEGWDYCLEQASNCAIYVY